MFTFSFIKKIISTILIVAGLSAAASAQVFPPDFICVNSDTLIWNLPTNTCGSFNSYEIFFSANEAGPYSVLATINDQNQTSFFHDTAGGNIWFYYLVSDFNCPGEPQISSDTLDTSPPEVSIIEVVTIENGEVELNWNASASPETIGYIIYRQTNIGVVPIDTVFGALTYIDLGALPHSQSETYFVNALDECGNTSIFDNPHNTIFLETAVDVCSQTILLEWNSYLNWINPIEKYEVWLSINSAPFLMTETIFTNANSYLFENANDGDEYCFFVKAIESNTGIISNSNIFCETLDIIQPIRDLLIKNISVTPTNEIEVTYTWNTDAEINQVRILSDTNESLEEISSNPAPSPLPLENTYLDMIGDANSGVISYQIMTTDNCDTTAFSNIGSTIFLKAEPLSANTNKLIWTSLGIDNAFSITYDIYRIVNGVETQIGTATGLDSTYFDPIDVNLEDDANACYLVIANAMIPLPNTSTENINSRSNIGCVEQPVRLFVPNAFAPRGVNREFKPLIAFGENIIYQMVIYDRYGKKIFVSDDAEIGWRGKINGKDAGQGSYIYTIEITQQNGEIVTDKGVFVLLR